MMRELSPFDVRMKAAFRRAVEQAGGGVAVASHTRVDASQITRYGSVNSDLMAPADVMLAVDRLAADPICLRVMAEEWKLDLIPFEDDGTMPSSLISTVADVARANGELQSVALRAAADNHLSANDKTAIREQIEVAKDTIRDLEEFTAPKATLRAVS